jgi:hypothetical protein
VPTEADSEALNDYPFPPQNKKIIRSYNWLTLSGSGAFSGQYRTYGNLPPFNPGGGIHAIGKHGTCGNLPFRGVGQGAFSNFQIIKFSNSFQSTSPVHNNAHIWANDLFWLASAY